MEHIDKQYWHKPIRHAQLIFASNGSLGTTVALVGAAATGFANYIIRYRLIASAVGTVSLTNGSGGTAFLGIYTQINTYIEGNWWDPQAQSGATPVYAVSANGIGSGVLDVWYITARRSAGAGATTL